MGVGSTIDTSFISPVPPIAVFRILMVLDFILESLNKILVAPLLSFLACLNITGTWTILPLALLKNDIPQTPFFFTNPFWRLVVSIVSSEEASVGLVCLKGMVL